MELQDVFTLMERFQASGLAELEVQLGGDCVRFKSAVAAAPVAAVPVAPPVAPLAVAAAPDPVPSGTVVRAPLVGTFYVAPSPDSAPFAVVGASVQKGQPLCLIEAMKMMSEIPAPCDCVIEEVLVQDGELVAYDAPLFRVREC